MRTPLVLAVAVLTLAAPAVAQAHVTLQPSTAAAGGYTRLNVRVPNERDDASTQKVELQFPDGFASASFEPIPGWDVKVTKKQLETPIKTDDGEITEAVDTITWTADDADDAIPPGAFRDFGLSVRIPGEAGDTLTFKALQTYTGGEVVRWIGAEDSDNPAPTVSVTEAAGDEHGADHAAPTATAEATDAERTAATTSDDGGSSDTLAIIALIVGALGLIVGTFGVLSARRATRT
ncbi:YcnI family protein [Solirubrobacter phytolaccae]|uniref:YcnI family protein n=1 Tax=Solirubrobacter phytolaccae TaxID=1404360 RepID=A0A9X3NCA4_9ACTN|nr:YcnI family protein [Solirubrobacter phytolaccae]MDA0182205.1 YcnI family protein [Solirubrobacter phytolaccae]